MKPEQAFWNNDLRPLFQSVRGLFYERVELRTGQAGFPDLVYCYKNQRVGAIELKARMKEYWDLSTWTQEQRAWAQRFTTPNFPVLLLIKGAAGVAAFKAVDVIQEKRVEDGDPRTLMRCSKVSGPWLVQLVCTF